MQAKYLAWTVFGLPIVAVHGSYLISLWQDVAVACFPYIEGCLSISRAARNGDAIYFFRGLMLPQAGILIIFWWCLVYWFKTFSDHHSIVISQNTIRAILLLGVIAAVFLVLYASFLGTEGKTYRYLRRYGVTVYFSFTLLAQMLTARLISQASRQMNNHYLSRLRKRLVLLVGSQMVLGFINIGVNLTLQDPLKDRFENQIEWIFAIVMVTFYALIALAWSQSKFRLRPSLE